jgi:choline dehydrogenase-like flavoprotein
VCGLTGARLDNVIIHHLDKDDSVVVVGSGPAGAAATLVLTRAGINVTLLEAGLARNAFGLTMRIAGVTVLRVHRTLAARSDGLSVTGDPGTILYEDVSPGGLTNHWSCAVVRFSRDDFLDARRAGEAYVWPIDYDELAPWYDWIEPHLRISGSTDDLPHLPASKVSHVRSLGRTWRRVADLARLEGYGLAAMPYAYGSRTTLTTSGTVFNSFVRLVKPAERSGHLVIRYGTRVTGLEWSGTAKRVTGVLARDAHTGAIHRVPCRAVVLAAGAINTAKLLLQSTNPDFPAGLGNAHGVLGRYLHDHPLGKLELDLASPIPFQPPAYLTRGPLERSLPLYSAACLEWAGVQRLAVSVMKGHPGRLTACGFSVFGTMAPSEKNFVALDAAHASADGTPGLILNIRHPPESGQALLAARDKLVGLLSLAHLEPRIRNWVVESVGSAIHYGGTCRMHSSPQFGMLDRWSRLHAVPNVAVADSAAFTTGPEKNPVLTAMALAARASQRLADDLRAGVI